MRISASDPEKLWDLATSLAEQQKFDEAESVIELLIEDRKFAASATLLLAKVRFAQEKYKEAQSLAAQSIEIRPSSEALHIAAVLAFGFKDYVQAISLGHRVLAMDSSNTKIRHFMAASHRALGELEKSIELRMELTKIEPLNTKWWIMLLLDMAFRDKDPVREIREISQRLMSQLKSQVTGLQPYSKAPKQRGQKIKVGFISPDFRNHSAAYFLSPLIYGLDRNEFELYLYFSAPKQNEDGFTQQFERTATSFVRLHEFDGVKQQVERIRDDHLDVILDAAGMTDNSGLPILLHRVAPIQASFLGYPGSSNFDNIDYCLVPRTIKSKEKADSSITNDEFSEKLSLFPTLPWCYRPHIKQHLSRYQSAYSVKPSPFIERGYITFGCCSHQARYNSTVLNAWRLILERIPASRLLLEIPISEGSSKDFMLQRLASEGFNLERVDIINVDFRNQYLTYHQIDIALDPFPCNGGTTTCDALWMGVPVVTLSGLRFRERIGEYLLSEVGLSHLVTHDVEDYVSTAEALAQNTSQLKTLRGSIRGNLLRSRIGDEKYYVRLFEQFIREATNAADENKLNLHIAVPESESNTDVLNFVYDDNGNCMPLSQATELLNSMLTGLGFTLSENIPHSTNRLRNLASFILRTEPMNERAIYSLAIVEKLAGNPALSQQYMASCISLFPDKKEQYVNDVLSWADNDPDYKLVDIFAAGKNGEYET